MERRLVLVGLAALAATPALAQNNPAPATDAPAAPAAGKTAAPEPAPAPAMKLGTPTSMSDARTAHIKRTLAVGSLSLATSRVAAPKVKHAMLKQFAGFEIAEQETIANIIKGMMMPGATPMGQVPVPTDAEVMGNLDEKGKAAVEKLRALKAGPEFEREYVKAQIDGHKQLLEIQEAYLKAPDDLDETNVAKLAKGMILEHLSLLEDIEKQLKG